MLAALPALYPPTHCHLSGTPTLLSSPSGKWDSSSAGHWQDKSLARIQGAPWIESVAEAAPAFLRHSRSLQQSFVFRSCSFLADLMDNSELIRNVTLCGHLHHGKVLGISKYRSGDGDLSVCFASPPGPWFSAAAPSAPPAVS